MVHARRLGAGHSYLYATLVKAVDKVLRAERPRGKLLEEVGGVGGVTINMECGQQLHAEVGTYWFVLVDSEVDGVERELGMRVGEAGHLLQERAAHATPGRHEHDDDDAPVAALARGQLERGAAHERGRPGALGGWGAAGRGTRGRWR